MSKITILEHLNACLTATKAFAYGLVGELASATVAAMEELESKKADVSSSTAVIIPSSAWGSDNGMVGYPIFYDIAAAGVTEKDRAEVSIAPGSMETAKTCGLCPTNQTLAGRIRIRAASVPSGDIAVEYWVMNGKE